MGLLEGKVALITGGGSGIGQGTAWAMSKEGALIAVSGRTQSKLDETVGAIKGWGGKAIAIVADINKEEDVAPSIAKTVDAFGGLDIMMNNAISGNFLGPLNSIEDAQFQDCLTGGPISTLRYMKAAYPHLKARGGGVIINMITSAAVRWDAANYGAYAALKQGIRALTRAAASEWGKDNIRAINVAPHALSPALKGWIQGNPKEAEAFFKTIPLGRVGDCEDDIGRGVVMLCSDYAKYITGITVPMDGGQAYFG